MSQIREQKRKRQRFRKIFFEKRLRKLIMKDREGIQRRRRGKEKEEEREGEGKEREGRGEEGRKGKGRNQREKCFAFWFALFASFFG